MSGKTGWITLLFGGYLGARVVLRIPSARIRAGINLLNAVMARVFCAGVWVMLNP